MNAQQQKAYTAAGLPEFDPQARAAFIQGWRAACRAVKKGITPLSIIPKGSIDIRPMPAGRIDEIPQ